MEVMNSKLKMLALAMLMSSLMMCTSSLAYKFNVGGRHGWVPSHRENYNSWASKIRFQVNDSIVFTYKKGSDSVLQVTKQAYDTCNVTAPLNTYTDGNSIFKFNHSGPFYFISGTPGSCQKGEKIIVVVMAVRYPPSPSPPVVAPPQAPSSPPQAPSNPPKPTPTPATPPTPEKGPEKEQSPSPAPESSPSAAPFAGATLSCLCVKVVIVLVTLVHTGVLGF